LLINLQQRELLQISKKLINIRPLNVYTKRGLRLSQQDIFKKIGKRSA
jgi:hypothetical protein